MALQQNTSGQLPDKMPRTDHVRYNGVWYVEWIDPLEDVRKCRIAGNSALMEMAYQEGYQAAKQVYTGKCGR